MLARTSLARGRVGAKRHPPTAGSCPRRCRCRCRRCRSARNSQLPARQPAQSQSHPAHHRRPPASCNPRPRRRPRPRPHPPTPVDSLPAPAAPSRHTQVDPPGRPLPPRTPGLALQPCCVFTPTSQVSHTSSSSAAAASAAAAAAAATTALSIHHHLPTRRTNSAVCLTPSPPPPPPSPQPSTFPCYSPRVYSISSAFTFSACCLFSSSLLSATSGLTFRLSSRERPSARSQHSRRLLVSNRIPSPSPSNPSIVRPSPSSLALASTD
ncbi:hypothetical protein F4780DRAFT_330618 [Xylariomycetidae sp. FL0641]|nr:hypothetical protein F4780DRAFT_330618 [Xylariomycetidae sp. FL0641]